MNYGGVRDDGGGLYSIIKESKVIKLEKPPSVALNMTDLSHKVCDWRRRLSHMKVTDSDLIKYDWRRRLGGGGAGV
jgi:hypothetical protein